VPFRVNAGDGWSEEHRADPDGWIEVGIPADDSKSHVEIEWAKESPEDTTYLFFREIFVEDRSSDERALAERRLHNLGYSGTGDEFEDSVGAFQDDYSIAEDGLLPDASLPPLTKARLEAIYDTDCDAQRPPRPGAAS